MNGTLKRLFVAGAAIVSLSAALALSGAQAKPHMNGGGNDAYQSEPTNVSPASPDAGIRGQGT